MTTNQSALDKFLKHHRRYCAVFIFSGDRHCSCGRDAAIRELEEMRRERTQQLYLFSVPVKGEEVRV